MKLIKWLWHVVGLALTVGICLFAIFTGDSEERMFAILLLAFLGIMFLVVIKAKNWFMKNKNNLEKTDSALDSVSSLFEE